MKLRMATLETGFAALALAALALGAGCSQPAQAPEPPAAAPQGTSADAVKEGADTKTTGDARPEMGPPEPPASIAPPKAKDVDKLGPKAVTTKSGLKYEDLVVGKGKEAKTGSSVKVHYTGWLTDGTKFDSSLDRGEPFGLTLPGQVIAGWNEGIPGMKAGGKRKLVIPSDLGYGDSGQGPIPAGATLVFEVEMVSVD